MTPAATLPLTVPDMVYVTAVLAVAAKFASVKDAEEMVSAKLTGLNTYPVLLGDTV
jgi:4-hydroxybenzoate polyprenyltransferase